MLCTRIIALPTFFLNRCFEIKEFSLHARFFFEKMFVKMKWLKSCVRFCVNCLKFSRQMATDKTKMSLNNLKRFGNYVPGEELGKGGFGVVFKANHIKTGSTVAMKVIDLSKADPFVHKSAYREVYLLANLKSPNIVRIFEVASSKRFFCIFMEYIHGKHQLKKSIFVQKIWFHPLTFLGLTLLEDLNEKKRYNEKIAKEIAKQIADALQYLHGKRIIHRDLKLENVMKRHLPENKRPEVVLIDFGFAIAWYPGCIMHTHCGSPEFAVNNPFFSSKCHKKFGKFCWHSSERMGWEFRTSLQYDDFLSGFEDFAWKAFQPNHPSRIFFFSFQAPEIFEDDRWYGASVDIWSFGVMMYSMMVGRLPFQGKNTNETMRLVCRGFTDHHLTNLKLRGISIFGRRMVARCLEVDSKQRITIKQIMENSWFFDVEHVAKPANDKCFKAECLKITEKVSSFKICELRSL